MNRMLSLCLTLGMCSASLAAAPGASLGPACDTSALPLSPSCTTPPTCNNPRCTKCRPQRERSCEKIPDRGSPPPQPREEGPPGGLQEAGAYIAPPRSGSTRGATSYRGLDGGSLTFPELRLRLPSIELPACFRSRSAARMHIDSAVAPWESHGYVQTGVSAGDAALRQRIAELEAELKNRESAPRGAGDASDHAAKEREAAEDYAKKLQEYEDLLKRCEEEQQRLRECIQNCLEQHQSRERGGKSIQRKSPQQSPEQAPLGPPPIPSESQFRRMPQVEFQEAPASYSAEPTYRQPPRLIAAPRPIREPKAPSAKITGVRAVK